MPIKLPNVQKPDNQLFQVALAVLAGARGVKSFITTWQTGFRGFGTRFNISRTTVTIEEGDTDERK